MVATSSDCDQHFVDDHYVRRAKTTTVYMLTYTDVFRVSAPNENKGKSKLLWAHGKKEHGLYFFEVGEMREETLHFKVLYFTDTLLW